MLRIYLIAQAIIWTVIYGLLFNNVFEDVKSERPWVRYVLCWLSIAQVTAAVVLAYGSF